MFTPIQQSTALPPLLGDLELLPGVIPLFREHGKGKPASLESLFISSTTFALRGVF